MNPELQNRVYEEQESKVQKNSVENKDSVEQNDSLKKLDTLDAKKLS
jgi:hypothetical protein